MGTDGFAYIRSQNSTAMRSSMVIPVALMGATLNAQMCVDIEGNSYSTVVIGQQLWMAENLRTGSYANGDAIPTLNSALWQATTDGAYAIYSNQAVNDSIYGKLYNWYAVNDVRGICPSGWHVPLDPDYKTLELELDMSPAEVNNTGYRGALQNLDGQLKASILWVPPSIADSNSSGFSALPAGVRVAQGLYGSIGISAYFWTRTGYDVDHAYCRSLSSYYDGINRSSAGKNGGYSCRCVADGVVGIDEDRPLPAPIVFPDPASTEVFLEPPVAGDALLIIDARGQVIASIDARAGVDRIPIAHLAAGTYFLRLRGSGWWARFVKH